MTRKKRPNQRRIPEGALQEKIEAAMRALPLWVSSDFREAQIYTLTEKYIYMAFDCVHVETTLTPKQIKSQLSKIEKQSRALFESLMGLQGPIIDALNSTRQSDHRTPTLGEQQRSSECLSALCGKAMPPNSAKLHRGRDRKLIPLKVAKAVACDFHSLTGKKPTCTRKRDGFPDFLSAIFKGLNMDDDSVEHFAKEASHWWHKERSNEVMESLRAARPLKEILEGPTGSLPTVQEWIQDQRHGRRDVEE